MVILLNFEIIIYFYEFGKLALTDIKATVLASVISSVVLSKWFLNHNPKPAAATIKINRNSCTWLPSNQTKPNHKYVWNADVMRYLINEVLMESGEIGQTLSV